MKIEVEHEIGVNVFVPTFEIDSRLAKKTMGVVIKEVTIDQITIVSGQIYYEFEDYTFEGKREEEFVFKTHAKAKEHALIMLDTIYNNNKKSLQSTS